MVQGIVIEDNCILDTNPATGEIIARVPCSTNDELDDMVEKANNALSSWSKTDVDERIKLLEQGVDSIADQTEELVNMVVEEMGKVLSEAKEEVHGAVQKDEYLEILQSALQPKKHGSCTVVRQALGVVVILSPWNFPVDEILLLLLPALGSGNTVIVKPSEVTPQTGARVVKAIASFLPDDVLQLAQGDGKVGAHLCAHPKVDMIAMTGSSETGKKILESAAPKMKRFVLELGGKDPMIVFDDADLEKAAKDAVQYSVSNAGQVCCSVERVYVPESVYDEFQSLVVNVAADYQVGNGKQDGVHIGPMVSTMQRDRVKAHVQDALDKGAKLLYQSTIPTDAGSGSSFHPVTVLGDISREMDISRQETFGPVVSISKYDGSEEEAIRLANDTEYGLASSVYSKDLKKAGRVADSIRAGQVGINCYSLDYMDVACPWVGHKSSGLGYHSGVEGFHQFSIPKTIVIEDDETDGETEEEDL